MIDRHLGDSRTSISITGLDKGKGRAEIKNVTGLSYGSNDNRQTFFQGGLTSATSRTTLNLGGGSCYSDSIDQTGTAGTIDAFLLYLMICESGLLFALGVYECANGRHIAQLSHAQNIIETLDIHVAFWPVPIS